jgi:hypothetical protein
LATARSGRSRRGSPSCAAASERSEARAPTGARAQSARPSGCSSSSFTRARNWAASAPYRIR